MRSSPGPWEVVLRTQDPPAIVDVNGYTVAVIETSSESGVVELADANLLAAAPALLAALESLFKHCAMVHKYWGEGDNTKASDAAQREGRAAIAQARGEACT